MFDKFNLALEPFKPYLPLLGWISLATFLLSLLLVPVLLARIPADYFTEQDKTLRVHNKMSSIHYSLLWLLRNCIGVVLIVAGIAMMVLPGQGLLTIFLGVLTADFPGKRNIERKIVAIPAVYESINWIREKKGVEQLSHPHL